MREFKLCEAGVCGNCHLIECPNQGTCSQINFEGNNDKHWGDTPCGNMYCKTCGDDYECVSCREIVCRECCLLLHCGGCSGRICGDCDGNNLCYLCDMTEEELKAHLWPHLYGKYAINNNVKIDT